MSWNPRSIPFFYSQTSQNEPFEIRAWFYLQGNLEFPLEYLFIPRKLDEESIHIFVSSEKDLYRIDKIIFCIRNVRFLFEFLSILY